MKARLFLSSIVCAALMLMISPVQSRQDKGQMPSADPGPEHEQLKKMAGEYTTVSKFSANPDEAGKETSGTAKLTSILGGRFLQQRNTGELFGKKTASLHLVGYNSATKHYEGTWVYTGSLSMMHLVGTSKDDGKTIHWVGTYEPVKGNKQKLYITTEHVDDNIFKETLVAKTPDGKNGPTFEVTYTRKK